jgi:hypothetical protein
MLLPKPIILLFRSWRGSGKELAWSGLANFYEGDKSSRGHFLLNQVEQEEEQKDQQRDGDHEEVKEDDIELQNIHVREHLRGGPNRKLEPEKILAVESHEHEEDFDLSEVLVENMIETIEFVLGTVSHTASYLRLWALALAHSELAKVLFSNMLGSAIVSANYAQVSASRPRLC